MNKHELTAIRDSIITAALPHVPFDGWTWALIEQATQEAGHDAAMARAVFPARMKDVLDGFADMADRAMLSTLEDLNPADMRVRDRVRTALMARFEFLAAHREALRESVQFWMLPTRKPRGMKIVWRTADRIWEWAGNTATDYNRYTKRGLLSGILVSSTLVLLNDEREDMGSVEKKIGGFIDRRIENVMQFGKVINSMKKAS